MNQLRRFVKNIATGMMVNESIVEANTSNEDWSSPWVGGITVEPEHEGLHATALHFNFMVLANENVGIDDDPMQLIDVTVDGLKYDNGFSFEGTNVETDCPENVKEMVTRLAGEITGKFFLGQQNMNNYGGNGMEFRSPQDFHKFENMLSRTK